MKLKKFDYLFYLAGIIFVIGGWFLPKSGKFALLDVALDCGFVWVVVAYLIIKVRKFKGGIKSNWYAYGFCVFLTVFALWVTKDFALDIIKGPQTTTLANVNTSKMMGIKGLSSLRYYLEGIDLAGNQYKIEVSSGEYSNVIAGTSQIVTYYKNTGRLYKLGGGK